MSSYSVSPTQNGSIKPAIPLPGPETYIKESKITQNHLKSIFKKFSRGLPINPLGRPMNSLSTALGGRYFSMVSERRSCPEDASLDLLGADVALLLEDTAFRGPQEGLSSLH